MALHAQHDETLLLFKWYPIDTLADAIELQEFVVESNINEIVRGDFCGTFDKDNIEWDVIFSIAMEEDEY